MDTRVGLTYPVRQISLQLLASIIRKFLLYFVPTFGRNCEGLLISALVQLMSTDGPSSTALNLSPTVFAQSGEL